MSPFVINEEEKKDKDGCIYDLYAVSQHFGSLGGGHYTAACRNPIDGKWYEFDDSSISKISE